MDSGVIRPDEIMTDSESRRCIRAGECAIGDEVAHSSVGANLRSDQVQSVICIQGLSEVCFTRKAAQSEPRSGNCKRGLSNLKHASKL